MELLVHQYLIPFIGFLVLVFLGFQLRRLIKELLRLSAEGEFPSLESNWGGLGRGLGGWNANRTLLLSVITFAVLLVFGSVAVALLSSGKDVDKQESKPKAASPVSPKPSKAEPAAAEDSKTPEKQDRPSSNAPSAPAKD